MRVPLATLLLFTAACDGEVGTSLALDVGNPGNCTNFQSPREVGMAATYAETAPSLGYGPGPRADTMQFVVPADGYGRLGQTLTLAKCDEHYHDPIEHDGACSIPVIDDDDPVIAEPPFLDTTVHDTTPTALEDRARPGVGTLIELHTAYASRVDGEATGLARCKDVVFVRASQWVITDEKQSSALQYTASTHYAGSTSGAGDEACKPPVWWEVVHGCFEMSKDDARLGGHPHPARAKQTYLSPMRWLDFI